MANAVGFQKEEILHSHIHDIVPADDVEAHGPGEAKQAVCVPKDFARLIMWNSFYLGSLLSDGIS